MQEAGGAGKMGPLWLVDEDYALLWAAQKYADRRDVNWELVASIVNNSTQLPNRNRTPRMCEERCV
jgi:hypothetical protein